MIPGPIVKIEDWEERKRFFERLYALGLTCSVFPSAGALAASFIRDQPKDLIYVWLRVGDAGAFWLCDREDLSEYMRNRHLTLVNSSAQFMAYGRRHGMLPQVPHSQ